MLKIKVASRFKKDLKKFKHNPSVLKELDNALRTLMEEKELPAKYQNHVLSGNWNSANECHIKPDALLIYRIEAVEKILILERIGTHAELFK